MLYTAVFRVEGPFTVRNSIFYLYNILSLRGGRRTLFFLEIYSDLLGVNNKTRSLIYKLYFSILGSLVGVTESREKRSKLRELTDIEL